MCVCECSYTISSVTDGPVSCKCTNLNFAFGTPVVSGDVLNFAFGTPVVSGDVLNFAFGTPVVSGDVCAVL
jgi:hypothetical protein